MRNMEPVHLCIVGGGVAALYAAYKYRQAFPDNDVIVLEREMRWGGRACTRDLPGTRVPVPEGAGVVRIDKDVLLRQWLETLNVPLRKPGAGLPSNRRPGALSAPQVHAALAELWRAAGTDPTFERDTTPFRAWATRVWGPTLYTQFVAAVGYTDFENADVLDTIQHYGFEDTVGHPDGTPVRMVGVPWTDFMTKAVAAIYAMPGRGRVRLLLGHRVTEVRPLTQDSGGGWAVTSNSNQGQGSGLSLRAQRCIMAVPAPALTALLPPLWGEAYRGALGTQPFVRVYARVAPAARAALAAKVPRLTYVPGPLQKIIPMRDDIYMIAYADNAAALTIQKARNTHTGDGYRAWLEAELRAALGDPTLALDPTIPVTTFFWRHGTHYYKPLSTWQFATRDACVKQLQFPAPHLFVVGEAVSLQNHGWVEGALESVSAVLTGLRKGL